MESIGYLEKLMKIESHEDIEEIQQFLLDTIDGAQLHETGCVTAKKTASDDGPEILLNTHMDVVSPHIEFERDGDIIRGRGACDAKGCLAPMVTAFSRFDPDTVTVGPGDTVVWKNTSSHAHTVTAYEDAVPEAADFFASGGFETQDAAEQGWVDGTEGAFYEGETFEHTFEVAGEYNYFCIPHEASGMVGVVEVTE